jgi:hypothetical protein
VQRYTGGKIMPTALLLTAPIWVTISVGMGLPGHVCVFGTMKTALSDF